jgi:glycosyltransferase involved in cell wall biosynthesis
LKLPDCHLLLIGGDFAPGGKAENWAESHNLNEGIDYAGVKSREEIKEILDNAALLIHPSLEESFGNILVEAMARCVPVVAGKDSGAVPWVLDNGQAGLLCDVSEPASIASAALEVLTSESIWAKYSSAGNRRVREAFSLSSVVGLALNHYRRVHVDAKGLSL